jgi:hypothetical protein
MSNTTTNPLPDVGAPFVLGLRERKFMLQVDKGTGRAQFYPRPQSLYSAAGTEWVQASGRGKIFALTHSRVSPPQLKDQVPYALALVVLAEGPRLLARVNAPYDTLRIGDAVAVDWDHPDTTRAFPVFKKETTA